MQQDSQTQRSDKADRCSRDNRQRTLPNDLRDDMTARRAQRHANTDFAPAANNEVRHQPVDPRRRHHEGQDTLGVHELEKKLEEEVRTRGIS